MAGHDKSESAVTIVRNRWSRCSGIPNWHIVAGVDRTDSCFVGATFVRRDPIWIAVCFHGLAEEALGRQQKVNSLSLLVDSAIAIFSAALDPEVCPIDAPPPADRALVFPGRVLGERREADRPLFGWRMVDRHTTLRRHFLEMPVTQRVSYIPVDADQGPVGRSASL